MWRRIREALDTDPSVELVEAASAVPVPAPVSREALTAATVGPAPLTDAAVIAQLRQQLEARSELVLKLQDELRTRPTVVDGCPGCAGLRKVVADLEKGRAEDRKTIARLQLTSPAGRAQTLGAPLAAMVDGGA